MSLDYTYLQVLSDQHHNPCESQEEVKKGLGGKKKDEKEEKEKEVEEKEEKKHNLYCLYSHWSMGKFLMASP